MTSVCRFVVNAVAMTISVAMLQCGPATQPVRTPAPLPPQHSAAPAPAATKQSPHARSDDETQNRPPAKAAAPKRPDTAPPATAKIAKTAKIAARTAVTGAIVIAPEHDDNTNWIHWQGWSSNTRKIGWRQGPPATMNRLGDPLEIARLGATKVEDRLHVATNVGDAIRGRSIGIRNPARTERKGPADVLVEVSDGVVAVIVRPDRGALGVLCRSNDGYKPVMTLPLRGADGVLQVQAEHAADNSWTAIVVHVGDGNQRRAWLIGIAAGVAAVSSDGSCGSLAVDALDEDAETP